MKFNTEKTSRICYIRALEKFAKSSISTLKREDFDFDFFHKRIKKNEEVLRKIKPVFLDSSYTKALEKYVNQVILKIQSEEEKDKIRTFLIKEANYLEKLKLSNSFKKDKYKNKKYEDNY